MHTVTTSSAEASAKWLWAVLAQWPESWSELQVLEVADWPEVYRPSFAAMVAEDRSLDLLTLQSLGTIQREYLAELVGAADSKIHLDRGILRGHVRRLLDATRDREAQQDPVRAVKRFEGRIKLYESRENMLRVTLADCMFRPHDKPPELRVIYTLAGVPICTAGNLTAITAQAKSGKSALIGAMIAAALTEADDVDVLGFETRNEQGLSLIHFDTEQDPADHWALIERARRRARRETVPPWLLSYCISGRPAHECRALLKQALTDAPTGVHSVLIDGVADLVVDVNDPAESNAFVAELHGLAIQHRCPIVNVLHFNPKGGNGRGDKARGHLGSQLERKSETNLTLDKEGEIISVWSEKQRRAPILRESGPRFRWDDEARMHLSVQSAARDRLEQYQNEVEDVFLDRPAMRYGECLEAIKKVARTAERKSEDRFRDYRKAGLIRKTLGNMWEKA